MSFMAASTAFRAAMEITPPVMVRVQLLIEISDPQLLWRIAAMQLTQSGLSRVEVEECIGVTDDESLLDCLRTILAALDLPGCDLADIGVRLTDDRSTTPA